MPVRVILYVEDNDASATLMQRILRARPSINLTIATDAAGARREIASREFRLILSDINLPDGSVQDIVEELRSDRCDHEPPIVVLSADPTRETIFHNAG